MGFFCFLFFVFTDTVLDRMGYYERYDTTDYYYEWDMNSDGWIHTRLGYVMLCYESAFLALTQRLT